MKQILIATLVAILIFSCVGCKQQGQPAAESTTEPATLPTEPETTLGETVPEETAERFESEIDFSDFATSPQEVTTVPSPSQPTEPEVTQPTEPATTQAPTEPATEPATEPEVATDPVPTPEPTTATPSLEPDGYNSQIVRP